MSTMQLMFEFAPATVAEPDASTTISPCGRYRYSLERPGFPGGRGTLVCVMLHPRMGTVDEDDAPTRMATGWARKWGYARVRVVNIFAARLTDADHLETTANPVGPGNDDAIRVAVADADRVLIGWGHLGALHGRGDTVLQILATAGADVACIGWTGNRQPQPLNLIYMHRGCVPRSFCHTGKALAIGIKRELVSTEFGREACSTALSEASQAASIPSTL